MAESRKSYQKRAEKRHVKQHKAKFGVLHDDFLKMLLKDGTLEYEKYECVGDYKLEKK